MKVYNFKTKQNLPVKIDEAWDFFSNPKNLREITPDWLNFKIINDTPDKMYKGLIIRYKVNPVLGIPVKWITEITDVNEPASFTDEQRKGPYKLWRHKHIFTEIPGGTEMIDLVDYAIPFDIVSGILNRYIVSKKIKEIFEFRKKYLSEKFI